VALSTLLEIGFDAPRQISNNILTSCANQLDGTLVRVCNQSVQASVVTTFSRREGGINLAQEIIRAELKGVSILEFKQRTADLPI
jgi:hypothetical protein